MGPMTNGNLRIPFSVQNPQSRTAFAGSQTDSSPVEFGVARGHRQLARLRHRLIAEITEDNGVPAALVALSVRRKTSPAQARHLALLRELAQARRDQRRFAKAVAHVALVEAVERAVRS